MGLMETFADADRDRPFHGGPVAQRRVLPVLRRNDASTISGISGPTSAVIAGSGFRSRSARSSRIRRFSFRKWFTAIWLITSHKKGIASAQLARDIGSHRRPRGLCSIGCAKPPAPKSFNRPLTGDIEADESRFGGKEKNWSHSWKAAREKLGGQNKPVLFGMLKRDGELRVKKASDVQRLTLMRESATTCAVAARSTLMSTTVTSGSRGAVTAHYRAACCWRVRAL